MKKVKILVIGALFISQVTFAQSGQLKKADNLYNKVSYASAAEIYETLIGSEVDNGKMKAKLGNCYYQMGQTAKSEAVYAQMVSTPDATSEDLYNYAQSLKENGKYAESDMWMDRFYAKTGNDTRAKEFVVNKNYVSTIEKQGAFFSISSLDVNTASADFGGYPMNDQTFFISNRRNRAFVKNNHTWNNKRFLDVYSSKREPNQQLTKATRISKKTNTRFHEGPLTFSVDNKKVYFTRNNVNRGKMRRDLKGIQNLKMFVADVDTDGNWINEKEFPYNNKDYSVGHPTLSNDGKTLFFASDMPGTRGGADLWKSTINSDGTFGKPENMGSNYNTEGQEMFPWVGTDGTMFFASDGHVGLGGLDVFAALAKKDGSFNKLMNAGRPINTKNDDFAFTMNKDGKTGYVSSNREGGKGDDDIYAYTQLKPFKQTLLVRGVVDDVVTKEFLPSDVVNLIDENGKIIATKPAGTKGEFEFEVEPDKNYTIASGFPKYFNNSTKFTTKNLNGETEVKANVELAKDPGLGLYALVTDSKENKAIEGVKMIITDNNTGEKFIEVMTPNTGDAMKGILGKKVGDNLSYTIQLTKEGYFTKTVQFNTKIDKSGIINVHEKLSGGLTMDKEVKDLRDLVQINDIRFDLNKYSIRPDAQIELNKVIDVMNKYPNMVIELGSHTDCRSSYAYNEKLSDNRAKASAAYIKSKIINPARIYGKGYGEKILLNTCACEGAIKSTCSNEEHDKNRRTEFKIIAVGSDKVEVITNSTNSFEKGK